MELSDKIIVQLNSCNDYFTGLLRRTIHSFGKYFLDTYNVSGMVLGARISRVNKTDKTSSPHEVYFLVRETENKPSKFVKYIII